MGAIDPKEGLYEHSEFKGLRNNVTRDSFDLEDLETALNVDIDDKLRLRRRKGYSAVVTAAVDRDLWAAGGVCLGVGSNALKQILPDYSTLTLRAGLTASRPLSYVEMGGRVYYANGVEMGCVENGANRTWGLTPPGAPQVSAVSGTLAAGKYQVVVAWLREDAQESGAGRAVGIELTDIGGISLTSIPVSTDATVTYKVIYATSVGGETLYRVGVVTNATTSFTINEIQKDAEPLQTQFLQPPPIGDVVGRAGAYLLVAKGNRLYPSEFYAPELFDWRKAVPFTSTITMLETINSKVEGHWVGTESNVIWMRGAGPETWEYDVAADYGVIPGTLSYTDGISLEADNNKSVPPVALFTTKRGLCMGTSTGELYNLTESRYAYSSQERGAGVFRRHRGLVQYVSTLRGAEVAGNVAA